MSFFLYSVLGLFFVLYSYQKSRSVVVAWYTIALFIQFYSHQFQIRVADYLLQFVVFTWISFLMLSGKPFGHLHLPLKKKWYIILILACSVSIIGSNGDLRSSLSWIFRYVPAFVLFFVLAQYPLPTLRSVKAHSIFFAGWLIQIPLILLWRLDISPFPNFSMEAGNLYDYAIGTLGWHQDFADFMILGLLFMFPAFLYSERRRITHGIAVVAFLLCYLEVESKHTIPLLFAALGLQLFLFVGKYLRMRSLLLGTIVLGIMSSVVYYSASVILDPEASPFSSNISFTDTILNVSDLFLERTTASMKFISYESVISFMANSPPYEFMFGYGPGQFGSIHGIGGESSLASTILFLSRLGVEGESVLDQPSSGFIAIWTEFGLVGLVSLYGLSIALFTVAFAGAMAKGDRPRGARRDSCRMAGILLFLLSLSVLRDNLWTLQFIMGSILLGTLFANVRRSRSQSIQSLNGRVRNELPND